MSTVSQPSTSSSLDKKVAVVTGGSRGIGLAIAEALIAAGASVVISGRDRVRLDDAQSQLGAGNGAPVAAVAGSVSTAADASRMIQAAVDRFGGLDVLVNNAGVGVFNSVAAMSTEEWDSVIGTNLTGVFHCCHAAIPHLLRRGGGWIVNISSLSGKNPFTGGAAYCASKAGLNAFSESLMQEVRHHNIRVSYIMPGSVSTGFAGRRQADEENWKLSPGDVAEVVMDLLR
ncbi:MAG: SDR family oxidoreductase, partial [Acidobacteria bacterium]|nr:SDR family oxidoreductase [Acidobacteriota bacterium]